MDGPLPFSHGVQQRLARAYGALPRVQGDATNPETAPAVEVGKVRDSLTLSGAASFVAGRVSPDHQAAPPIGLIGDAIPMYANPAAKNAAATGVMAGRMIDVTG